MFQQEVLEINVCLPLSECTKRCASRRDFECEGLLFKCCVKNFSFIYKIALIAWQKT